MVVLLILFIAIVMAGWAIHKDSNNLFEPNCTMCKLGALFILLSGLAVVSNRTFNQLLHFIRTSRLSILKSHFANAVQGRSPPLQFAEYFNKSV